MTDQSWFFGESPMEPAVHLNRWQVSHDSECQARVDRSEVG